MMEMIDSIDFLKMEKIHIIVHVVYNLTRILTAYPEKDNSTNIISQYMKYWYLSHL